MHEKLFVLQDKEKVEVIPSGELLKNCLKNTQGLILVSKNGTPLSITEDYIQKVNSLEESVKATRILMIFNAMNDAERVTLIPKKSIANIYKN